MVSIRSLFLTPCLILPACAEGETDPGTIPGVTVTASHFMYGFGGDSLITDFPIPAAAVGADLGFLNMTETGRYTVARPNSSASTPQQYVLEEDGSLALVVPISNRAPTRYLGAYQQSPAGDLTQAYFFTDRYAPKDSEIVGFYWGTRTTTDHDMSKARGDWHLFSQHVLFSSSPTPNLHNIGRSFQGSLTIAPSTDKGDELTGSGYDSAGRNKITLGGTARALDTSGEIDFTVLYNSDSRTISASQAKDLILGVDSDETDGEVGLFALVRKFEFGDTDPTKNPKDPAVELGKARTALAGRWHIGLQTIFMAPTASGIDAANGTLTLDDEDGFKIEVVGSLGPQAGSETFRGTYQFQSVTIDPTTKETTVWDNLIELTLDGTNETWWAAVDSQYGSLVILDWTVENRIIGSPQLNIGLAVKELSGT